MGVGFGCGGVPERFQAEEWVSMIPLRAGSEHLRTMGGGFGLPRTLDVTLTAIMTIVVDVVDG